MKKETWIESNIQFMLFFTFFIGLVGVIVVFSLFNVSDSYAAEACGASCVYNVPCDCGSGQQQFSDCGTINCYDSAGICVGASSKWGECNCNGSVATGVTFRYACASPNQNPDTTPPTCDAANPGGINITPTPVRSGVGNISITAKASDDRGIRSAGLYILRPNGSIIGIRDNADETGFVVDGSSKQFSSTWASENTSGTYQIQANWTDTNGNFKQCTQDFFIDKDVPACGTWTFSQPSPTAANTINITTTATDIGSGIVTGGIYYLGPLPSSTNTAIYPNNNATSGTMTVDNFTTPSDGKYTFQANWWDSFGNFNQCKYDYIFNKNPPSTTLTGPAQVCLNTTVSYSVNAYAQNGLDVSYFTYYKPSTSSWQTSPFPLYQSGISGSSYSGSGNIVFTAANGFVPGNSYYIASGAYDDLGMKCSGNQILFPTNPNQIFSGSAWNYCGDNSRKTVSIIDKPAAVTNLRDISNSFSGAFIRWTGVSTNINDYTVTTPSGTQQTLVFCANGTNNCGANYITGSCKNDYTYTISEKNTCGAGTSKSITSSPNCMPTCSLSLDSGSSNPFVPGATVTVQSDSDSGDQDDYIASWAWSDYGPDKGSYNSSSLSQAKYTLMNRYSASTTLKQSVYDSLNSTYTGTCSITVVTADPTITVGPVPPISIIKSATNITTKTSSTVSSTLLNDNDGTLRYNQSGDLSYNGVLYKNICMESGVICSFSNTSNVSSTLIGKSSTGVSRVFYITVPRGFTPGVYAYGMELSSVKWDNTTALLSQSNNLVTIENLPPICSKPTISEYSTYSGSGYPMSHSVTITAAGVSDYDGVITLYTWNDTPPGSGVLNPLTTNGSTNKTTYTTPSTYSTTNYINYSVRDNNNAEVTCPQSDPITTLAKPGVAISWYNYSIDINKTLSNSQNFTWTQSGVSSGYSVLATYAIDNTSTTINGKPNICKQSGVTCLFDTGSTSISETVAVSGTSASATHPVVVTVPNNIAIANYSIQITGLTTYRGVSVNWSDSKVVNVFASPSTISVVCGDGSSGSLCNPSYSENRGWISGGIKFNVISNGFDGKFTVNPYTASSVLCNSPGVTCRFSTSLNGTYTSSLSNISLTSSGSSATKEIYMKISTSKSTPPLTSVASFIVNGTRNTVLTETGNVQSPGTVVTLNNQPPVCGVATYTYNPATPVPLGSTVTVTVGGATDPDNDSVTYGAWYNTAGRSISAVSGSTNSATIVMNNVYNSCTEVRYKAYDQYSGESTTCVVPQNLCTIVDSVPPTAQLTSGNNAVCKGALYPVSFSYADNDALTQVSINKKDPVSTIATKSGNFGKSTTLSGSTTFDTAGTYYVYPVAKDANNNVCDSSGSVSCGAATLKQLTVNENISAPTMSFITYANSQSKVRVTWTKPDAFSPSNYTFTRASGTAGTLSAITCVGNDCGVDITGLSCTSSYSYVLLEKDENTCSASSTISNVAPNCAPTCGVPTVKSSDIPPGGLYPLNTLVTINSNKKAGISNFDNEDGNAVTHIWAPSLSGTGLGGITAGGADATYRTPNRNNLTVSVVHSVRDTGGPNDDNFVTVVCGSVSFPMASDGLSTPVYSPGSITVERTSATPAGSSNFTYDLTNFQPGTFAIDTANTNNASFIGNNICQLTNLVTCTANSSAPVGNGKSIPVTLTFKGGARTNFDTTKPYKVKGTITYATTDSSGSTVNKSASAYLNVSISDNAPTCKVYSRLKITDPWVDVTGQYYTYSSGSKVFVRTVGSDVDGDTISAYSWTASAGSVSPSNTQESVYTVSTALSSQLSARVYESAPNNKYGTCTTVMKTPDPGTHTLSNNVPITASDTSLSVTYSYSGYVNANFDGTSTTGVDGSSIISKDAIPGYTNICAVSGVTCRFDGLNVGDKLAIPSGSNSSKNIIIDLGSTKLNNLSLYAIKVAFSAPTLDGKGISANASGGTFVITDSSPTCGNISISPAGVFSGTSDSVTISASGRDDWKIDSAKLEYNSDATGTNVGSWITIGTVSSFSSTISPTATFTWQPGTLDVGRYQLRVTWTDNRVPSQSVQCSALNASSPNNPASSTDLNNSVVSVDGNRFSGRVLIQSDGPSSTVLYRTISKDTLGVFFGITNSDGISSTNSTWNNATGVAGSTECRATYPNGVADSDTCVDYFVSNNSYRSGTAITSTIIVPVVGGTPKYTCTYDVIRRDANGTRTIIPGKQNQQGCIASFSIEPGNALYSSTSRWTTEVDFYLTYNTDRISGRVFDYAGVGLNGYDVFGGYGTKGATSGASPNSGVYSYPISATADSKDYLPNSQRTFTLSRAGDPLGTSVSPNKCFYAFNSNGLTRSFSANDIKNIARGGSLSGWIIGEGCTTESLSIVHGNLSPLSQNRLYFFVVPKITVNSDSSVKLVNDCITKANPSVLPVADSPTVNLFASDGTTQIGEGSYNTSSGKFTINDVGTSTPTELLWNTTYVANLSINVNYIVCNNRTPSFKVDANTTGTGHTEPNVNSSLTAYPSGIVSENQVIFDFYVAPKNNNDWWQVYDGGAHANGIMDLIKLPQISISGTPTSLPLVQNINTGALVSSADKDNIIDFHNGKAGNSPQEWYAEKNGTQIEMPYKDNDAFFTSIIGSANWSSKNNFASAISSNNNNLVYVYNISNSNFEHSNSSSNGYNRPIVVFGNLDIKRDLTSSSSKTLVILVKGNVTIASNVQTIQAAIYATGNITVQTKGDETDPQLIVTGSLISDSLNFKRDLPNAPSNSGRPSSIVSYDARILSNSSLPSTMKEAKAYWVIAD